MKNKLLTLLVTVTLLCMIHAAILIAVGVIVPDSLRVALWRIPAYVVGIGAYMLLYKLFARGKQWQ